MFFIFLSLLLPIVYTEGVSVKVNGHDELCVFAAASRRGEKLAFYYSVQSADSTGNFDIEVNVYNTKHDIVLNTQKDSNGDYVFSANAAGEYSFCFNNHDGSTKMLYVDVTAESDTVIYGGQIGTEVVKPPSSSDQSAQKDIQERKAKMEEMMRTLNSKLDTLHKQMMYIKAREGRSISTGILLNSKFSKINTVKDSMVHFFRVFIGGWGFSCSSIFN